MPRTFQKLAETAVMWGVILLALGVFGGACFVLLRAMTALPVWAAVLISVPGAIGGFLLFAWTHQTNGFDGPTISMDEFRAKLAAMTPAECSQYLAEYSEEDRESLERELRNTPS